MDILYLNKINYVLNYYRSILILDLLEKVQDSIRFHILDLLKKVQGSIRFHRFLHVLILRDLSFLYF